jgi:ATP-dependent DNA helicase RecG
LLYGNLGSENARARMKIMRETEDGFLIAEEDLRLRGAGELLGTRQSGMPDFKVAMLEFHSDLIPMARDDAKLILETDPELKTDRGQALRVLLYLMEQDEGIRYLRSG